MALTEPRKTDSTAGRMIVLEMAPGKTIYQGALVAIDATGKAIPAEKAADQPAVGCAYKVSGGTIVVERGSHFWDNDPTAANKVTAAHIGKDCYIVDDATVTSLAAGSSKAGKVLGIDGNQVIVETL